MNRRRFDNPVNEHISKVLLEIKDVARQLDLRMEDQHHQFRVLEQAVEMNLWVQLKIMHEGVDTDGDVEELVVRVRELQREYLAIVAISNFLQGMGSG